MRNSSRDSDYYIQISNPFTGESEYISRLTFGRYFTELVERFKALYPDLRTDVAVYKAIDLPYSCPEISRWKKGKQLPRAATASLIVGKFQQYYDEHTAQLPLL